MPWWGWLGSFVLVCAFLDALILEPVRFGYRPFWRR